MGLRNIWDKNGYIDVQCLTRWQDFCCGTLEQTATEYYGEIDTGDYYDLVSWIERKIFPDFATVENLMLV